MPGESLKAECSVQQFLNLRDSGAHLFQLRFQLQCSTQSHFQIVRNKFGNTVNFTICHIHGSANIADCSFGAHCSKGNNLADAVATVLIDHVLDDFATAILAEVDVNIRHGDTFRIEETLKQEIIGEWVKIGYFDGIRNK